MQFNFFIVLCIVTGNIKFNFVYSNSGAETGGRGDKLPGPIED